ncbi:hypothetical protein FH972_005150 [Carpinus fangiana]|uniref:Uncharacterized protein n=1 Tax=Carpinus fangiana TaxID=176857 RepID=A0A5N6QQ60_9ROSI|nr:hypothetical protein FH972_005150 [Carpinus fangiana]
MAIRVPAIMHVKQLLRWSFLSGKEAAFTTKIVPKGCFAVYVGEGQKKRFILPISYLNEPSFQKLLNEATEEFGFDHPMGGLTIPCREEGKQIFQKMWRAQEATDLKAMWRNLEEVLHGSNFIPEISHKIPRREAFSDLLVIWVAQ